MSEKRNMMKIIGFSIVLVLLSSTIVSGQFLVESKQQTVDSIESSIQSKELTYSGEQKRQNTGLLSDWIIEKAKRPAYEKIQPLLMKELRNLLPSDKIKVQIFTYDINALGAKLRSMGVDTKYGLVPAERELVTPILELDVKTIIKIAGLDTVVSIMKYNYPEFGVRNAVCEMRNMERETWNPECGVENAELSTLKSQLSTLNIDINKLRELKKRELKKYTTTRLTTNDISKFRQTTPRPTMRNATEHQGAQDAWAKGFTGKGVNVAITDTGIDFGHPDLVGRQARVNNSTSPYNGWPIVFDSSSLLILLQGYGYPWGNTGFANTSYATGEVNGTIVFDGNTYNVAGLPTPSKSGIYHIGYHPDANTWWFSPYFDLIAVLVVDANQFGKYDTVYVDLNGDFDFSNDKPLTKGDEIAYADIYDTFNGTTGTMWNSGDGFPDISGGMMYFISDGVTPIPYSDIYSKRYGLPNVIPSAGSMVAFTGEFSFGLWHGTGVAATVAGQGKAWYNQGIGMAPNATLIDVPIFNVFSNTFDAWRFAVEGYDGNVLTVGDQAQISSNSFGYSSVHNDGFDEIDRFLSDIVQYYGDYQTTFLVAAGNGGPGYGTITTPTNGVIINVGASTEMGYRKIPPYYATSASEGGPYSKYGDVIPFSGRGPTATGSQGPDVVAVGAFGYAAIPLWYYYSDMWNYNGYEALDLFGGTSQATPATAGITALIYEAYKQSLGAFPKAWRVKRAIMSSADDIKYDILTQGAGYANASRAVDLASYSAGFYFYHSWMDSTAWIAGDFDGTERLEFPNIVYPGDVKTETYYAMNRYNSPKTITLSSAIHRKIGEYTYTFEASGGRGYKNTTNIKPYIPAGTDLLKVTSYINYSAFDSNNDYSADSNFYITLEDWTDTSMDGYINTTPTETNELNRFTIGYNTGTSVEATVHDPITRSHDGLLVRIYRARGTANVQVNVVAEFYQRVPWSWLSFPSGSSFVVSSGGTQSFDVRITVPADAPLGLYEGSFIIDDGTNQTVIPVIVNVASNFDLFTIGGYGNADSLDIYNNSKVRGMFDWNWRAESGDWRYYFFNVGSNISTDYTKWWFELDWNDTPTDTPTDIDVLLLQKEVDQYSQKDPLSFGPYKLSVKSQSKDTHIGNGIYKFQTATGMNKEVISVPATQGLNEILLHNVLFSGINLQEGFRGEMNRMFSYPLEFGNTHIVSTGVNSTGFFPVTFNSSKSIDNISTTTSIGMSKVYNNQLIKQDTPSAPATSSWLKKFRVTDGTELRVSTTSSQPIDIDLYILFDTDGNNQPDFGTEVVASSLTMTADELVTISNPQYGTYWAAVHGYNVPTGVSTFNATITIGGLGVPPGNVTTLTNQSAYQDVRSDPTTSSWTYSLNLSNTATFRVEMTGQNDTYDLDLYILYDANKNGVVDYPAERIGRPDQVGSHEPCSFTNPADGQYWIWAHGFNVPWGGPALFDIRITITPRGTMFLTTSDVPTGNITGNTQYRFNVTYNIPPVGGLWDGVVTYGPGYAPTVFQIPVRVNIIDRKAPVIQSMTPSPGTYVNITTPQISAIFNDSIVYSGLDANTVQFTLDGTDIKQFATIDEESGLVSLTPPFALAEGPHTVTLSGSDNFGNTATAVTWSFTVDTKAPPLKINTPADGTITQATTININGTTEVGASIEVNTIPLGTTTTGYFDYSATLLEGQNNFTFIARDLANNLAVATLTIIRDTIAPPLTVTNPSTSTLLTNNPMIKINGTTEIGAKVMLNNQFVSVDSTGYFEVPYVLAEGVNNIVVVAIDAAGNTATVTRIITLDTRAPTLSVTTPEDNTVTRSSTIGVSGVTEVGATLLVNGNPVSINPSDGSFSTTVSLLSDRTNTITIESKDAAGNMATIILRVIQDSTAPTLTVSSPTDNLITNRSTIVVTGTTEYGSILRVNNLLVGVDTSGTFNTEIALSDGVHDIVISSTDTAGNSATITRRVTVDTIVPILQITAPKDNSVFNTLTINVTGVTDRTGTTVAVNGNIVNVSADGTFTTQLTLSEGTNTLSVAANDIAGNRITLTRTVLIDTTLPSLTVNAIPQLINRNNLEITGIATDSGTGVKYVKVNGYLAGLSANGNFTVTLSLKEGDNTIYIEVLDNANNLAKNDSLRVTVDTIAPPLTINAPSTIRLKNATITGTTEVGATVTVNNNAVTVDANGGFTTDVQLTPGTNNILIVATDSAGNVNTEVVTITYLPEIGNLENDLKKTQDDMNQKFLYSLLGIIILLLIIIAGLLGLWFTLRKLRQQPPPPREPEEFKVTEEPVYTIDEQSPHQQPPDSEFTRIGPPPENY